MLDGDKIFKPRSTPLAELKMAEIFLDEFEAARLCDHDGISQIAAAERMKISRGTVQRLLEAGRFKIIDALLHDHAIRIHKQ